MPPLTYYAALGGSHTCGYEPVPQPALMRTIVSLPAGLAHMNVWKFLIFTALGAAIWNTLLIAGATLLAGFVKDFEVWVGIGTWVLIGAMLVGYVFRVVTWKPRDREEQSGK